MPEFQLDLGNKTAAARYRNLDAFAQGYIEAVFFTETGASDDGELANATPADLPAAEWLQVARICRQFRQIAGAAYDQAIEVDGYSAEQAGRDFWFTRNGHGVGFWDRDELPKPIADALTEAARRMGNADLYRADNGKLFFM